MTNKYPCRVLGFATQQQAEIERQYRPTAFDEWETYRCVDGHWHVQVRATR